MALLTSDAVDKVVDGDDVEVLLEEADGAVGGHVAAAARHQDRLANSGHAQAVQLVRLKMKNLVEDRCVEEAL